jgi:hypothetical protein
MSTSDSACLHSRQHFLRRDLEASTCDLQPGSFTYTDRSQYDISQCEAATMCPCQPLRQEFTMRRPGRTHNSHLISIRRLGGLTAKACSYRPAQQVFTTCRPGRYPELCRIPIRTPEGDKGKMCSCQPTRQTSTARVRRDAGQPTAIFQMHNRHSMLVSATSSISHNTDPVRWSVSRRSISPDDQQSRVRTIQITKLLQHKSREMRHSNTQFLSARSTTIGSHQSARR